MGQTVTEKVMYLVSSRVHIDHLEDPKRLDAIDRAGSKGYAIADTIWAFLEVVTIGLTVVVTLVVMASATPMLVLIFPLALITLWLNKVGQDGVRRAFDASSEASRVAQDLLLLSHDPSVAGELRVMGSSEILLNEYQRRWDAAARILNFAEMRAGLLLAAGWLVYMLGVGGGLAWVAFEIGRGAANPGDLVLILMIARQQQLSVQMAVNGFSRMSEGAAAAGAYRDLVESPALISEKPRTAGDPGQIAIGDQVVPNRLQGSIAFRGVTFTYPGRSTPAIAGVDLELDAGTMVALVGAHGSGKTSLVKLVTGMYAPTTGHIEVDGVRLDSSTATEWRARTSAAFQDFLRLEALVSEAVGVGDLKKIDDLEHIRGAISAASAGSVVDVLPEGIHTQLGTTFGGLELSGGQWQKLALARACMRSDPLLVVLDEPTAALDPVSELEVYTRQYEYAREMGRRSGTVTIVVSHRFSTVRMADKIVVLDRGAIVEYGSHVDLLSNGGKYARLYQLQRDSYIESPSDESE